MAKKAEPGKDGKWPGNVSVEYISPEEREQRIAQAPPGGGATVPQAPGTITTKQYNPNQPNYAEEHAQEMSEQLVGRAAIVAARQLGLPFVRSTQSKKRITIESAETICRQNPGLVYFDFDDIEEHEQEVAATEEPEAMPVVADNESSPEGLEFSPEDIAEAEDEEIEYQPPTPQRLTREQKIALARHAAETEQAEVFDNRSEEEKRVSETSRRAWGATLSTPGIQVYMHPKGIVRVDVEGPLRIQKGRAGDVRVMRIQRIEQKQGGTVRNVTQTTVTGAQSRSPNPQAQHRMIDAPKIPIPTPPPIETDTDEDTEY